ncbi:MAG: 1-deoxy-D-xylulose-5-phosphate reductoisomerase [Candidatus Gracilibacteria bacterium]
MKNKIKNIVILGSTGSVGTQALEIVRQNKDAFKVIGLSCHKNINLLKKQVKEFDVKDFSATGNEKDLMKLATLKKADLIINALVGEIGVAPTLAGIHARKNIAIANKEAILCIGKKLVEEAKKYKVNLIPVDSEHTGIFQILKTNPGRKIKKIILTCSGGPFYKTPISKLKNIKLNQVFAHPTWKMGEKVTIDSATLMNKGFEVIECGILYGVNEKQVEVLYHPQGVLHCAVEFEDGRFCASISQPDMKLPIAYAMNYPFPPKLKSKIPNTKNLILEEIVDKFGLIGLCRNASKSEKLTKKLCRIDEIGTQKFLDKKLNFLDLIKFIKNEYSNNSCGR